MIVPRFSALFAPALTSTLTPGVPVSISLTLLPAASSVSPCGVRITPSFFTFGATRNTYPPTGALMFPWLTAFPAPGTA